MQRMMIVGGTLAAGILLGHAARAADAPAASGSFAEWLKRDQQAFEQFTGRKTSAPPAAPQAAPIPPPAPAAGARGAATVRGRVPPGERIFFVKTRRILNVDFGDLYSMNPDGSDAQPLTDFAKDCVYTDVPEISRDGRWLAFVCNVKCYVSAFYKDGFLLDLKTGGLRRVTGDERPAGVPAQTGRVAVQMGWADGADNTNIRISYKGCDRFFTPDVRELAVPADENIWIKAEKAWGMGAVVSTYVTAGGVETVTLDMKSGTVGAEYASPSPDGGLLAVAVSRFDGKTGFTGIAMYRADGTPLIGENVGGPARLGGDTQAVFSPDGTRLAYCAGRPVKMGIGVLSTANLSAPPQMLVAPSLNDMWWCASPCWSPDGRFILYVCGSTDVVSYKQFNIFRVPAEGGAPQQLTAYTGGLYVNRATYSPDGRSIVFSLHQMGGGPSNVYVMPAEGGPATPLTSDGCSLNPCWGVVPP